MQIIIPMSGFGERFRRAGYREPKALIEIEGKPIIAHVIDLFPGARDLIFVCNQDHLDDPAFAMAETIRRHCPDARIVGIAPHKLGPVNAVMQAIDVLDPEQPVIVNYCDFSCYWDYAAFVRQVESTRCDGAIACYTGFHPHMMGSTNYAYVRVDGQRVLEIQEKQPYTTEPMREYASSGTYYFRSARLMRECFERTMARPELALNGEYYVSLAYRPLLEDGGQVLVHEIEHFMQWGTPQDLAEYRYWSDTFRALGDRRRDRQSPAQAGTVLIPMAGLGSRFVAEGYARPKPLLPVSGEPMVVQAARDLPEPAQRVFIQRRDLAGASQIAETLRQRFTHCQVIELEQATDGQARTCLLGLTDVDLTLPLTIGACDNGAIYDPRAFRALFDDPEVDVIVWAARGYPGAQRRPQQYGWIDADEKGRIRAVSVKQPLADPARDPIVIGTFTFRRGSDFVAAATAMIERDGRVNGEFYVDTCINDAVALGLRCRVFEVEHYLCWGTPADLRGFEYWQSCFHKWDAHPYRLERDRRVSAEALAELEGRARVRRASASSTPRSSTPRPRGVSA